MYIIESGINKSLDKIASEFYNKINPKKKTGVLYKYSLIERIKNNYSLANAKENKYFYNTLIKNDSSLLDKIIKGKPYELKVIVHQFEDLVDNGKILPFYTITNGKMISTDFGKEVMNLFDYKGRRGSQTFIWWAEQLGIRICPYCNCETTFLAEHYDKVKILHDVDHFIPKVKAPYLSLSFYNILPTCHNCNSSYKQEKIFDINSHIHPYFDDFDSIRKFSINNIIINNDLNSFDIYFKLISSNSLEEIKSNNHINDLGLIGRYKNFKNNVLTLDIIRQKYPEERKSFLLSSEAVAAGFPKLKNRDELLKSIAEDARIPFDKDSAKKTITGKLLLDIAKEFKILE